MVMDNFPLATSAMREFAYSPRKKNVSDALDEVIQSIAKDDVNTWHKKMDDADIRLNYDMTLPCVIGTLASLTLPAPIAEYIHDAALSYMTNPVNQFFMRDLYFPDLRRAMAEVNLPFDTRMIIFRKLIGAVTYLFFGFEFTENRSVFLEFDNRSVLQTGAFFLPMVSVISHLLSGNIFDWELALS